MPCSLVRAQVVTPQTSKSSWVQLSFKREGLVGVGAFGIVHRVRLIRVRQENKHESHRKLSGRLSTKDSPLMALKEVSSHKEASLMSSLDHDHITKLFFVSRLKERSLMFMEYEQHTLAQYIALKGSLMESEALQLATQLWSALDYLHEKQKVCHRDVKPTNLLIGSKGIKVIDFGNAARLSEEKSDSMGWLSNPCARSICSLYYRAPELLKRVEMYSGKAIDMWSTGCILYEMLEGHKLFKAMVNSDEEQMEVIVNVIGHPNDTVKSNVMFKVKHSRKVAGIVNAILVHHPTQRPTAKQCSHMASKSTKAEH